MIASCIFGLLFLLAGEFIRRSINQKTPAIGFVLVACYAMGTVFLGGAAIAWSVS